MILILSVSTLIIISVFGLIINITLFWKFFKGKEKNAFLKYCLAKTVPNVIVCSSVLFWSVPITSLSVPYYQLPLRINVLIGQVSGFGAYVAGALIELLMAINRCFVIYFPTHEFKFANTIISLVFLCSLGYSLPGILKESCGFVYDPDVLIWRPEATVCATTQEDFLLYSICGISILANALNVITFLKLCCGKVDGISDYERARRRRTRTKLFVQSVIQNCLHVIDMINFNFISKLHDALWFQFVFISVSFLSIHTLDGLVMYLFHPETQSSSSKASTVMVMTP